MVRSRLLFPPPSVTVRAATTRPVRPILPLLPQDLPDPYPVRVVGGRCLVWQPPGLRGRPPARRGPREGDPIGLKMRRRDWSAI